MSLPRNQTTNNKLKGHSLHTENPQILSTGDINCETKKKKQGRGPGNEEVNKRAQQNLNKTKPMTGLAEGDECSHLPYINIFIRQKKLDDIKPKYL